MSSRRALSRVLLAARSGPNVPWAWHASTAGVLDDRSQPPASTSGRSGLSFGSHSMALPFALSQSRELSWFSRKAVPSAPVVDASQQVSAKPPVIDVPAPDPEPSVNEAVSAIYEACGAVEEAALSAAREDSILAGGLFIDALQAVHMQTGLPWWVSIALVNIMTRACTLPVLIASQKATSQMAVLNLDLLPLKKMQEAMVKTTNRDDQLRVHNAWVEKSNELRIKYGPQITRTMLTMFGTLIVNSLVFISIFNGVSTLMTHKAPSLTTGGAYWFLDLTQSDPMYGLPLLCTLTTLGMVQYGMNVTGEQMASPERAGQAAMMKNVFRFFALLFIPFGGYVPSGVALLWASNSCFSVFTGITLRQDGVRRALGLPTMAELASVSERAQAAMTADPMSFVPPASPIQPVMSDLGAPGPSIIDVQPQAPQQQQQQQAPPPPAGWAEPGNKQ